MDKKEKSLIAKATINVFLVSFIVIALASVYFGGTAYNVLASPGLLVIPSILTTGVVIINFAKCLSDAKVDFNFFGKLVGLSVLPLLAVTATIIFNSPLLGYSKWRNQIGEVKNVEFSEKLDYIDLSQLPTVDSAYALKLADKKLGEIPSLGSQTVVGHLTLQSINGELYYVAPLEHSGLFKWISNRQGSAGYIKVSATNENDVELVTDTRIKVLDSAYLLDNLDFKTGIADPGVNHSDYSFELDDEYHPYWVVTRVTSAFGFSGEKVVGTVIIDAETGETKVYSVEDTPKWVDRIQPKSVIYKYINNWGELVHGKFNFSGVDKLKATEGISIIYNQGKCYYYTGITSVGGDESIAGFILTDTRTGEATFYSTSGATEKTAVKSAEGKVQQYGYEATFPYLINIQNEPTYFTTLKDSSGLVKQYAMINVKNYSTVATGDTLQSTLNNYIDCLTNSSTSLSNDSDIETIKTNVIRVGQVVKDGTSYYDLQVDGSDRIFTVSTETSRSVALVKEGDSVEIGFIGQGNSTRVLARSFKITSNEVLEQSDSDEESDLELEVETKTDN